MATRKCKTCGNTQSTALYSKTQLKRRTHKSTCMKCSNDSGKTTAVNANARQNPEKENAWQTLGSIGCKEHTQTPTMLLGRDPVDRDLSMREPSRHYARGGSSSPAGGGCVSKSTPTQLNPHGTELHSKAIRDWIFKGSSDLCEISFNMSLAIGSIQSHGYLSNVDVIGYKDAWNKSGGDFNQFCKNLGFNPDTIPEGHPVREMYKNKKTCKTRP